MAKLSCRNKGSLVKFSAKTRDTNYTKFLIFFKVEQVLPVDERGTYAASLVAPSTNITSLPCVVTGKLSLE